MVLMPSFPLLGAGRAEGPPKVLIAVWAALFVLITVQTIRMSRGGSPFRGRPGGPSRAGTVVGPRRPGTLRLKGLQVWPAAIHVGADELVLSGTVVRDVVIRRDEDLRLTMEGGWLRFTGDEWLAKVKFHAQNREALEAELLHHGWAVGSNRS